MSASEPASFQTRSLAGRLRAGEPLRALFVKMPAPAEVELAGHAGFDAVILDTEHGPDSGEALEHHLRAADAARISALVRVPGADAEAILAALDGGAVGVVVPHVSTAATARAIVAAAHYPPLGERGLALTTRAGRYGRARLADHLQRAERDTVVVVQIEDSHAIPRAREILAVDGVDAVLIGATDLSISLGHPGAPEHPEVQRAIDTIVAAAVETKSIAGTVVADPDASRAWQTRGGRLSVFVSTQLVGAAFATALDSNQGPSVATRPPSTAPLVLLPGMLCTPALWDKVAATLVGRHAHTVRPGRIDLDDTIAEMAETVLVTAPPRFAIAGHSLGGIVALEVVRRAPHRVRALAILNASARPPSPAQLAAWSDQKAQIDAGGFAKLAGELASANLPRHRRDDAELVNRAVTMSREVGRPGFERQLAAQATRPDSRPSLRTITCPVLVVSGADDEISPPSLQDELATAIPGSKLMSIRPAGTCPLSKRPLRWPRRSNSGSAICDHETEARSGATRIATTERLSAVPSRTVVSRQSAHDESTLPQLLEHARR